MVVLPPSGFPGRGKVLLHPKIKIKGVSARSFCALCEAGIVTMITPIGQHEDAQGAV